MNRNEIKKILAEFTPEIDSLADQKALRIIRILINLVEFLAEENAQFKQTVIHTANAPAAIGTYSQAIKAGNFLFISGQIPLALKTTALISENFTEQAMQAFQNFQAVVLAGGAQLAQIVKLTIFLTNLKDFAQVNEVMARFFTVPYPARAAVEVSALPKGAQIEIEGIAYLGL